MGFRIFDAISQDCLLEAESNLLEASGRVDDPEISRDLEKMAAKVNEYIKLAESESD